MNARDYFRYPLQFLAGQTPTEEERIQDRIRITDPRTSGLDKFMGTVGQAVNLAPEALINTGVGLTFAPANLSKLGMVADAISPIGNPLHPDFIKGINKAGDYLTTQTPLRNAYKVNPSSSSVASSVDDVGRGLAQVPQAPKPAWQLQEMPGLHLKSTMTDGPISKIVEPKTGLVNVEQALGIIGKESGGADKVALIKQGLGETLPKKMDYNQFRKVVQDQLIPLERQFVDYSSNYGINRLGYKEPEFITRTVDGKVINEMTSDVIENQTLILGNKSKFGRGSSAHGNPEETLGHIHFLRDAETPDVLTVTQIQSDAFQGTHRIMPDKPKQVPEFFKQRQEQQIQNLKKSLEEEKAILNKYKTNKVDDAGYPIHKSQIDQIEKSVRRKEQDILFKGADLKNLSQKQLLDKNHQERYLQELVDYAGKRGDINKVRVPTSETAAKVQGYSRKPPAQGTAREQELLNEINKSKQVLSKENPLPETKKVLEESIKRFENALKGGYDLDHQTILKKYSKQPKTIKKLFGKEPTIVTDSKGNTWYEFDIPDKFKKGKGEIKAFNFIPPIVGIGAGIGTAAASSNEYKQGGNLNTFNYQQNMLPLQTITEPQEVELTPEQINYYRSLGYEVEELD
jgi:hypothetical protein